MIGLELHDACHALFSRVEKADYEAAMAAMPWEAKSGSSDCLPAEGALSAPAYEDYRHFFNMVLTPGIPRALPPVESLYRDWGGHRAGLQHGQGFYLGPSAQHVKAVCSRLDIEVPAGFEATPDHLLLLLELQEFLDEHAPADQAQAFAAEHFGWLPDYRRALEARSSSETDGGIVRVAAFYCTVVGFVEEAVSVGCDFGEMREVAQSA